MTDEPTGSLPLVRDGVELYDHEADEHSPDGYDTGGYNTGEYVVDEFEYEEPPRQGDAAGGGDGDLWVARGAGDVPPRRERRAQRRRRRGWGFAVAVALGITLVLGVVLSAGWLSLQVNSPFQGDPISGDPSDGTSVSIEVRPGWGTAEVADALADAGVIDSKLAFQIWARVQGATFQAGTYSFCCTLNVSDAIDTMERGPDTPVAAGQSTLLVPPGLTLSQIADRVGRLPGHSRDGFLATASSGVVRSKYQPADTTSLEGLTWPDTYFIGEHQTDEEILRMLVSEFDEHADAVGLGAPSASGWSPYEAVVVASLVQGEAGGSDQPMVAGVMLNRLRQGMPLQIDATLCYLKGGCPPVPTNTDKQSDSPYNTYRVTGLPPTPILTVTESALRAALAPAEHDYLFYVTGDDGVTRYATTYAGHQENIRQHGVRGE